MGIVYIAMFHMFYICLLCAIFHCFSSLSCVNLEKHDVENGYSERVLRRAYSTSAPATTNCLLGNFEVSMQKFRWWIVFREPSELTHFCLLVCTNLLCELSDAFCLVPLPCGGHLSYDDRLEDNRGNYQNCSVLWHGGATGKAFGLAISRLAALCNNLRQVV